MKCHYCNREINGDGIRLTSTDGIKHLHFCDRICSLVYFYADIAHTECFDRETIKECIRRRKEYDPDGFFALMAAMHMDDYMNYNNSANK